ncbi:SGNH/GDSL hydrolase family protein [Trujillonella endophytica]|uniref:SGNH/GDSL hydrolase family protein n=1 Tax=Trujillonella endophytica TaxID=673521 RepID=UPI001FCDF605|nr:SGNH/GDSL hydrolase family protein [Trujillella endophytica]
MTDSPRLHLALLGDSIAFGTGTERVEDGLGPRLAVALRADGHDVALAVLAVPGAVSADLAAQVRRAVPGTDLAVVVVGANDLARMVAPERAATALGEAVRALRAAGADVVVVPAPDMSSLPLVPPALRPVVRAACAELQRRQEEVAESAGARVAAVAAHVSSTFDGDLSMFAADRYHPSSAGYAAIAAVLVPFVLDAARARRDGEVA